MSTLTAVEFRHDSYNRNIFCNILYTTLGMSIIHDKRVRGM